jgi:hypothetical protein
MLEVRDPADVRSVFGPVLAITAATGLDGAVRYPW